jgi:hypothetical protein
MSGFMRQAWYAYFKSLAIAVDEIAALRKHPVDVLDRGGEGSVPALRG